MTLGSQDRNPSVVEEERAGSRFVLIERALALSRLLVVIPVVVLLFAALGAFLYGTYVFIDSIRKIVIDPVPVGHKIGLFLLVIDLFLIGATLLIAAIGFYELFVGRLATGGSRLPRWLQIDDLNELKARVIAMIVAVSFVESAVDAANARRVLETGVGIGAVIVALTVFLRFSGSGHTDA